MKALRGTPARLALAAWTALSCGCIQDSSTCDECVFTGFAVRIDFESAIPESTYGVRLSWDGIVRPCSLATDNLESHLSCGPRASAWRSPSRLTVTSTETPDSIHIEMIRAGTDSVMWSNSIRFDYVLERATECSDEARYANVRIER